MLKIEKFVTMSPEQWEIVIEGMRNPKNSWDKIDSYKTHIEDPDTLETADFEFFVGENDQKLMESLAKGGPVHAKYRRMMPVWLTIKANMVWWAEFDTYKVGTVRNSCSKMHKIHVAPFTIEDFSHEGCEQIDYAYGALLQVIDICERLRNDFNRTQDKKYWRALIELLPEGYNMKATVLVNYEVLHNIYISRKNHKMLEWHTFCDWIKELPYSELITMEFEDDE